MHNTIQRLLAISTLIPALLGCAPADDTPQDSGAESAGADAAPSTDDSAGADTTEPAVTTGRYAEQIQLIRIEANQGVAIPLFDSNGPIPPANRSVGLIEGRTTLIRAYWSLDARFVGRDLLADLHLEYPDGRAETLPDHLYVTGPPAPERKDGTFHWILEPQAVVPGMTYHVALRETAFSSFGTAAPERGARAPLTGVALLGVEEGAMSIDVAFVPMTPPEGEAVPVTEADRQRVETALMELTPVQGVSVAWHDPVAQSGYYDHPEAAWDDTVDLRHALGLGPGTYLHLFLNPNGCCDAQAFDFTGFGGIPGDSQDAEDATKRSAFVLIRGAVGSAAPFIIHELGHNQGLTHAPCGDNIDNIDPDYPYKDGLTLTQGFGVITQDLHSGDPGVDHPYYDIMTYCWPVWYSDYNFERLRKRVAAISRW